MEIANHSWSIRVRKSFLDFIIKVLGPLLIRVFNIRGNPQYLSTINKSNLSSFLKHGVYKLKLSHDGKQIVTLHLDGRISFWNVPSMRLVKTWAKSEQVLILLLFYLKLSKTFLNEPFH